MIDGQPVDLLTHAERMSPKEIIEEVVDADLYKWIGTEYRRQLVDHLKQREMQRGEKAEIQNSKNLAYLGNKLARVVYLLGEVHNENSPENQNQWKRVLYERLLGNNNDSIVNAMGPNKSVELASRIRGSLAPLTLTDLVRQSRPGLREKLKMSEIVASPDEDAHGKVDLELVFGDKNDADQEIVRIVQLKSRKDAKVAQIYPIQEDNLSAVPFVDSREAERMLTVGEAIKKAHGNVEVRAFVIEVPGIESEAVGNNPFGGVQNKDVVRKFATEAVEMGFLPTREAKVASK